MVAFIDDHREQFGVEPICRVLPIAPSTYFKRQSEARDPSRRSTRAQQDAILRAIIRAIWNENHQVYGPRKVWKQMGREGLRVARCRVRRLMREMGLAGASRGRTWTTTTQSQPEVPRPADLVDRHFTATGPNQLWVADFTYVATWRGFVYVAFVIDVFARRIVGWRLSSSLATDFVLDALEQALYDRGDAMPSGLVHHSDRGTQYLSMRYTDQLAEAGIAPSVGSRGDSYDCARRIHHRALQDRGHSAERSVAPSRVRRIRHPRVGRLVQSPTVARANRLCATGLHGVAAVAGDWRVSCTWRGAVPRRSHDLRGRNAPGALRDRAGRAGRLRRRSRHERVPLRRRAPAIR